MLALTDLEVIFPAAQAESLVFPMTWAENLLEVVTAKGKTRVNGLALQMQAASCNGRTFRAVLRMFFTIILFQLRGENVAEASSLCKKRGDCRELCWLFTWALWRVRSAEILHVLAEQDTVFSTGGGDGTSNDLEKHFPHCFSSIALSVLCFREFIFFQEWGNALIFLR